jgi:hypothetical protein
MNTLRVKIALLFAVVIVSVVGLLTLVLFYLLGPPKREHSLAPVAEQVEMVLRLANEGSGAVSIVPLPAPGRVYDGLTQRLRERLAARGADLAVTVSREGWRSPLTVSVPVAGKGWVLFPITDQPPPGVPLYVLIRWLLLITIGAIIIAVFVANRMVRPLALLESAVESVGPDGVLPALPERGPPKSRQRPKP